MFLKRAEHLFPEINVARHDITIVSGVGIQRNLCDEPLRVEDIILPVKRFVNAERLEKARVKALEVRQKNKAERDLVAKEEKEKVEKVASFLKNDDLFEKKYANKFDKITDMLSNVETYLSEVKDVKKKKLAIKEEERLHKERAMAMVKEDLTKLQEAEAKVKEADAKEKLKVEVKAKEALLVKTYEVAPVIGGTLPNYRNMHFGRRTKGIY